METGKTLYGTTRLAFDMVEGVTHIVEGMYRNIAATPLPFGRAPEGPAPGIAGLVHEIVRGSNQLIRKTTDQLAGVLVAPFPLDTVLKAKIHGAEIPLADDATVKDTPIVQMAAIDIYAEA